MCWTRAIGRYRRETRIQIARRKSKIKHGKFSRISRSSPFHAHSHRSHPFQLWTVKSPQTTTQSCLPTTPSRSGETQLPSAILYSRHAAAEDSSVHTCSGLSFPLQPTSTSYSSKVSTPQGKWIIFFSSWRIFLDLKVLIYFAATLRYSVSLRKKKKKNGNVYLWTIFICFHVLAYGCLY